jgi:hypothetical protein
VSLHRPQSKTKAYNVQILVDSREQAPSNIFDADFKDKMHASAQETDSTRITEEFKPWD